MRHDDTTGKGKSGGRGPITGIDFDRAGRLYRRQVALLSAGLEWRYCWARASAELRVVEWLAAVFGKEEPAL